MGMISLSVWAASTTPPSLVLIYSAYPLCPGQLACFAFLDALHNCSSAPCLYVPTDVCVCACMCVYVRACMRVCKYGLACLSTTLQAQIVYAI